MVAGLPARAFAADDVIRLMVGFQAGGGLDLVARALSAQLNNGRLANSKSIVENKPGAAGRLAASLVAHGPKDGSQLLVTPSPVLTLFPHTIASVPYDPLHDFAAVGSLAKFDYAFAVATDTHITSLKQYIRQAKDNKKLQTFGSPGIGLTPDFVGMMLARANGFKLLHVGYKGTAPALQDLMGGQIAAVCATTPALATAQKTGRLRVLATTGARRSPELPDVPTFQEEGIKDLVLEDWFGLFARAGTPNDVIASLNKAVQASLADKKLQSQFKTQGFEVAGGTPEEAQSLLNDDYEKWASIVKAVGYKATS